MAELVYAHDLESCPARVGGSSPLFGTHHMQQETLRIIDDHDLISIDLPEYYQQFAIKILRLDEPEISWQEFAEFASRQEEVFGLVLASQQVVISSTPSHPKLQKALRLAGLTSEVIGRFQIQQTSPYDVPSFGPRDSCFQYFFLALEVPEILVPLLDLFQIDVREKVGLNRQKQLVQGSLFEILAAEPWSGLFSYQTMLALFFSERLVMVGSIISFRRESILNNLTKPDAIDFKDFALIYDPLADRLVSGRSHAQAQANLGYSNTALKELMYYPQALAQRMGLPHQADFITIRQLLKKDKSWLPKLARRLLATGFSPETVLRCEYLNTDLLGGEEYTLAKIAS